MTVRDYYTKHFDELTPEAQFHFATRIKNWFKTPEFDDFLKKNEPPHDLSELFHNNNYSKVNNFEFRRPYFEKYKGLFGLEASLFRINHLLNEYQVDLRRDLLRLIPRDELYALSDTLLADNAALITLSTYAVNVICLTEILYPRRKNVFALLARKPLHLSGDPTFLIYLATHVIICDTNFYTRQLTSANLPIYHPLFIKSAKIISQNLTKIPLDAKLEFLVCCKIINAAANPAVNATKNHPATWSIAPTGFLPLVQKISLECQANLRKSPILLDPRKPDTNDLSSAEHRNTLYILSGLDSKNDH